MSHEQSRRRSDSADPHRGGDVSERPAAGRLRLPRLAPQAEIVVDLPSRLADALAAGRLDVAMIPSIEYVAPSGLHDRLRRLHRLRRAGAEREALQPRAGRADPHAWRFDEGSRTSAALARILLNERFGLRPRDRAAADRRYARRHRRPTRCC